MKGYIHVAYAQQVAERLGHKQVVILAESVTGRIFVTSYGKTRKDRNEAARVSVFMKKVLEEKPPAKPETLTKRSDR